MNPVTPVARGAASLKRERIDALREAISLFATLPVMDIDLALAQRAVGACKRYRISY
ncbi:MAG: hypothetical protein OXE42_07085 [Gammaproteobacteria bacterium]|nr:hypothetical protein [Gammaproteobacteria bacterium]